MHLEGGLLRFSFQLLIKREKLEYFNEPPDVNKLSTNQSNKLDVEDNNLQF